MAKKSKARKKNKIKFKPPALKSVRMEAGMSIRQLAKKAGIDRTKIGRWESGRCLRILHDAMATARTLGTDVATLFGPEK